MKPFDLETALRGDPVVTRDGRKVTQLINFDTTHEMCLRGIVEKRVAGWKRDGRCLYSELDSKYDLFMAPKKVWLRVMRRVNCYYVHGPFDTEEEARKSVVLSSEKVVGYFEVDE